eukprot:5871884-Pleurochrysis_carterae.AAC.1
MITYQDFGSGFCKIVTIGTAASRLFVVGISVVDVSGPFGVWNNGVSPPYRAAALASGEFGSASGWASGASPVFVGTARARLGSVCSPWSSF